MNLRTLGIAVILAAIVISNSRGERYWSLREPRHRPGQLDRVGISTKTRRCAPSISVRQSCEHVDP